MKQHAIAAGSAAGVGACVRVTLHVLHAVFRLCPARRPCASDIYNAVTILFAVVISIPIAKTTEVQEAKEADYRHAQVLVRLKQVLRATLAHVHQTVE